MNRPHSEACDRNRVPILHILKKVLRSSDRRLLEVGSGTGQHAHFFAQEFPDLEWMTSDLVENHEGIRSWIVGSRNISGPVYFESGVTPLPAGAWDVVFTANTLHIMGKAQIENLLSLLGKELKPGAMLLLYGPFRYRGKLTSNSNVTFDRSLRERNQYSGIRDFEWIQMHLEEVGFRLVCDYSMPANNRLLHFEK